MFRQRLSEAAKSDLRDIRDYSKTAFGARTAGDHMRGLGQSLDLLKRRPFIGSAQRELGEGVRRLSYRSHRIYYHLTDELITILRVLHHAQDERAHFGSA